MEQVEVFDEDLSRAVIVWTGFGLGPTPSRSGDRLIEEFGCDAALDLLPRVTALEDSFYMSDARLTAPDLDSMGITASAEFREIHPELSPLAVRALAWCYTYDYK